jgi:TonB family protein
MHRRRAVTLLTAMLAWASLGMLLISHPSSFAQQEQAPRKIVSRAMPVYPELARKMHITGTVKVRAMVEPSGRVKSAEATGGHPLLIRSGVDAVEKWRWEPAPHDSVELVELNFHPE